MKKIIGILMFLFLAIVACERIDLDDLDIASQEEVQDSPKGEHVLIVRSGASSTYYGDIYVPQGVGTLLKIESNYGEIKSASWKIDGSNYEGLQVSHKFNNLGENKITISAEFKDGSKAERDFTAISVLDISSADPVQIFTEKSSGDSWDVLFLFSKERLRYAKTKDYYYDGLVVDWKKKSVPENNSYIINKDGKPELVNDIGKYVGVKINLTKRGLYNIVLIHSVDNWTDLAGSKYVRSDNVGRAWFWFENGNIISQGNSALNNAPGLNGDNYFRFTVNEDNKKVSLFFKLKKEFTTSSFVLRQEKNGNFSKPINMTKAKDHDTWGQLDISIENQVDEIFSFRYGPDSKNPTVFSENMYESYYYDKYFNSLRLAVSLLKNK